MNDEIFFLTFSFIFGSIIGSFLNVVILRLPKGQSLNGHSHCTTCGHGLSFLDLFPLFSYLFLGGRCRHCGVKFSPRYFIIELITGLLFTLCWLILNPQNVLGYVLLFKNFIAIAVLIVVFVIDLENFLIFDSVIITGSVAAVILNLALDLVGHRAIFSFQGNFVSGIIACVLAVVPFFATWYFSKGKWMGFGDVKFALFLGLILGMPKVFVALMLSVFSGGLLSIILLVFTNKTLKTRLPFGTFLSFGAVLAIFYGDRILAWYLSFLGF